MSSIDKLLVQGIRSFGSADDQKAAIQFGTPLTLITGQNGAGKTTIIECLKYVTSGDLPPNGKGGAFVRDPKLVGEREVRGLVKLKFRDVAGHIAICHRMLQSIQKPRKIEQRTLDSSLEKIVNGEKKKITTRCGEIDREMIDHLGVSKAILNHVIFCHQEESSWPLSEGKALKAKFDEIFASTRYTKALENIKKFQQEQTHECKVHSAELHHLKKQKEKVEELQGNLRETQGKVDVSKAEITRIKSELEPVEHRLQELNEMYQQVTDLERNITELDSSRRELERSQTELMRKIEHQFTGTMEELRRVYDDHHSQLERNEHELQTLGHQHKRVYKEEEVVKGQLGTCYQEHGRLETEEKHHQSRVQHRDQKIVSLAEQLKIEGCSSGPFSPKDVKRFLSQVVALRQQKEERAKQEKQEYIERECGLQEQLNDLRANLAQLEQSKKMRETTMKTNQEKIATISRELASLSSGDTALEGIEEELRSVEQELAEHRSQIDIPSLEAALRSFREEKKKLDERVVSLQQELGRISQHSGARGALEALRRDKRSKEEVYQNEVRSLEMELLSLLGYMPAAEKDLILLLKQMERSKGWELEQTTEKYQQDRAQLSRLETQKEEAMKQLTAKRSRMQALQREVADVCGDSTYEEALEGLQREMDKTNDDLSTVKGSQSFFRKSLEKVHAQKKCPLCTRGFPDDASLERTIQSITSRLNESIPRLLPKFTEQLQTLQERQKRLQELRPKIEELTDLRTGEVPQLERTHEEKSKKAEKLQMEIRKAESEQSRLRSKLGLIHALKPRVVLVSQLRGDLQDLDKRISVEAGKIGGGDPSRSQIVVNRELREAQMRAEELNRKMDNKRQEITSSQQSLRELEERVHGLKEEKLKLQGRLQQRQGLLTKKGELAAEVESCEREIKRVGHQLGPVRSRISKLEGEKAELVREREEGEAVSRAEIDSLKSEEDAIQDSTGHITRYINDGRESALRECVSRMKELQQTSDERGREKKSLEERINALRKQLANAKVREHELQDNMQLLRQRAEIEQKRNQVGQLKEELRRKGLEGYEDEFQRLQREADRLRQEQSRVKGHKLGQEDRVRDVQRELQSDLYKDADTRHRDMLIILRTTELANSDLEKYYKALDRAIMRYHSLKMQEINKIIKELWIKTYRGGDIDTIEICSDDELEESGTIRTRRVYHYRVVMIKGGTTLDMRGRCSAGQKVLTSIIIRLALAETFCINCGLLALDEPTTNLDRDNVEGLAQALADIVKERSQQKNFQLIVITHDEAFVELLGHSGYADYYYKVSKEVGECSRIKRLPLRSH